VNHIVSSELANAIEAALLIYDECEASGINEPVAFGLGCTVIKNMLRVSLNRACMVFEAALLAREIERNKHPH
jgi:hypothetical protein